MARRGTPLPLPAWGKFRWDKWLGDLGLRACSPAARGVWIDMLAIAAMHAEKPGFVGVAGNALGPVALGKMVGVPLETITHLLDELERNRVFSRDRTGAIYSRRMVKDMKLYRSGVETGPRGVGTTPENQRRNSKPQGVKPQSPPRARVLESKNLRDREEEYGSPNGDPQAPPAPSPPDEVQRCFDAYNEVARQRGLPIALSLTDGRRDGIRRRIKGAPPGAWDVAMIELAASDFCAGCNDRGWKADLAAVLQPKTFNRLIEGFYRDLRAEPAGDQRHLAKRRNMAAAASGAASFLARQRSPEQRDAERDGSGPGAGGSVPRVPPGAG